MRTNRFLRVQAGRLLIVEAAFCLLLAVTGGSVQAHVEEVSESSPSVHPAHLPYRINLALKGPGSNWPAWSSLFLTEP